MTANLTGIKNWIFDLDNTLYPANNVFFDQIMTKMTAYVGDYLELSHEEAYKVQKDYYHAYGTTLSGLMTVNNMDPGPFLDYVHDVDLTHLTPCMDLRAAIKALPGRKFIFTNGSRGHGENVSRYLELLDLMDGVFGVDNVDYIPKPNRKPYEIFCDHFNVDPTEAIMFEDSLRNLEVPKEMGMQTVFIAPTLPQTPPAAYVDHMTNDLAGWLTMNSAT